MDKPKRIIDINGDAMNLPVAYYETINIGRKLIDEMEKDNIDRSDMRVVIDILCGELKFDLAMLKDRVKNV